MFLFANFHHFEYFFGSEDPKEFFFQLPVTKITKSFHEIKKNQILPMVSRFQQQFWMTLTMVLIDECINKIKTLIFDPFKAFKSTSNFKTPIFNPEKKS